MSCWDCFVSLIEQIHCERDKSNFLSLVTKLPFLYVKETDTSLREITGYETTCSLPSGDYS